MKFTFRSGLAAVLPLTAALLLIAAPRAAASAEDQVPQAEAASESWVGQIDQGKYEDSYDFACTAMRDKVKEDRWVLVLKSLRGQFGPVLSRHQLSHVYKPDGVPGLNGECMVLKYDTSFKNYSSVIETVVLKWEDGKWRGAGYNLGPKPGDDAQQSAPQPPVTEIQTDTHARPQPNQQ